MRETLSIQPTPAALPKPAAPRQGGPRRPMSELRTALSEGWEIIQPIFARPQWSSLDDRRFAFHFVLRRERATRLVTVPETRTITRFIREHALEVDNPHPFAN